MLFCSAPPESRATNISASNQQTIWTCDLISLLCDSLRLKCVDSVLPSSCFQLFVRQPTSASLGQANKVSQRGHDQHNRAIPAMDIKKILIADEVSEKVVESLRKADFLVELATDITATRLKSVIQNYDAILVRSRTQVTRDIIEASRNLKLIARAGVGVDNVDIEAASERSILVINAPNGNTVSAAELTCGHILTISRNLYQAAKTLKDGVWNRKDFVGCEVAEKTLGIVGLGRIGREVGRRMKAFDMQVIGYDPVTPKEVVEPLGIEFVDLEEIWRRSDYISFHVPLMPETKHLLNRSTLARCKDGVMILNCARGGIVDEAALLESLNSRKVAQAGLDVYEVEPPINEDLLRHPHCFVTPHLGASTRDGQRRVGEEIVDEIIKLTKGQKIPGAVNANRLIIPFLQ